MKNNVSPLSYKIINIYFSKIRKENLIKVAKTNKVLYQLGKIFPEIQKTNEWLEISRRRVAQLRELKKFNDVASDIGLKYTVVKTFRFPEYVPDDIDILVHPESLHLLEELASILIKKHGYFFRSKGTTEMTLRKTLNGTHVDLDIHSSLGAGPYVYLNSETVFEHLTRLELEDACIPSVNKDFELIICSAHAIMKEFELTLADILMFLHISEQTKIRKILEIAENVGLRKATCMFCKLSWSIAKYIVSGNISTLPYKIPMYTIIPIYIENLKFRMKSEGIKPEMELLTFPRAKGIKKLLRL